MNTKYTLATIADGAAVERFDVELAKVAANITDINTDAKSVRKIVIEIEFRPDANRSFVNVRVKSSAKLSPEKPYDSNFILESDGEGGVYAVPSRIPTKPGLLFEDKEDKSIIKIEERR